VGATSDLPTPCPSRGCLQVPGILLGVSAGGRLLEVGYPMFPSLNQPAWAAQYQAYLAGLSARLAGELAGAWGGQRVGSHCSGKPPLRAFLQCPDEQQ